MDQEIWLSARATKQLETLLEQYIEVVENGPMTTSSQNTYISQAQMFVKWVKGEFEPGERLL